MMPSVSWNSSMSTQSSGGTEEPSLESLPLFKSSQYIWFFGSPIILVLGNFGNVMTIIIMRRLKSSEAVINIYFTALAVIDLVTLDACLLGTWVGLIFGYDFQSQHNLICKIYNWIVTGSTTIGGWFLVGLTTHRAVSVVWPHRVNLLCTRRLVTGVVLGTVAFHAVVYSHYLYGYSLRYFNNTSDYQCTMMLGSYMKFVDKIFTYIDLVLYSLLPFASIFVANIVLIWKLRANIRDVRENFSEKGSDQVVAREKAAISVTWTVIVVSVTYVVLTLPVFLISLLNYFAAVYDTTVVVSSSDHAKIYLIDTITYMLMFSNSAVNFYLYCLTGQRFRKEFVKMFCPTRPQGASSG